MGAAPAQMRLEPRGFARPSAQNCARAVLCAPGIIIPADNNSALRRLLFP